MSTANFVYPGGITLETSSSNTNALDINTTAGGVDIDAAGDIEATTSATDSIIRLRTNGGTAEQIFLQNDQGTSSNAIDIGAVAGGISFQANNATNGIVSGAARRFQFISNGNIAQANVLRTNGGTAETLLIQNSQGTSANAIDIDAVAGGVDVDAAGVIALTSAANATGALTIETNTGISETIEIVNNQGTGSSAIHLNAVAGGINVDASGTFDVDATGPINLTSTRDNTDCIELNANGASASELRVQNTTGTGTDALQIHSLLGGIELEALNATNGLISATGDTVRLTGIGNATNTILIRTNTGTSETIALDNNQGTSANAIRLNAAAGGAHIECATAFEVSGPTTNTQDGIRGVTTGNADAIAVLVDSAGQLGTVSSARRYKTNIEALDGKHCDDLLTRLQPVSFRYKKHPKASIEYGYIAEDMEEVMPELVVHNNKQQPETIQYHKLHGFWGAIAKYQQQQIQDLQKRLLSLEQLEQESGRTIKRARHS